MTLRGRGPRVLLLLVVFMGSIAAPAYADTGDDLARARAHLAAAQKAADAAAGRYETALAAHAQLEQDLELTQHRITDAERREQTLQQTVEKIAVRAYVGAGEPVAGALFFGGDDLLDFGRTTRLLDSANAPNVAAIDELDAVHSDLERDRDHLAAAKDDSDKLLAQLDTETKTVQDELLVADHTRRQLETQFAQEQQQQQQLRLVAAARQAEAAARAQATTTKPPASGAPTARPSATPTTKPATKPTSTPTTKPANPPPPTGNRVCPVRGSVSFVDSWGAPRSGGRSHEGVDMMAARGTPNVAIVAGTVTQKVGALAGNGVYLSGDDGNSYWYFHLDRYEGGPRHVAQGEVVGYTGNTGNADGGATHTHFEYHPGHGGAANPYPIVRPIC